MFAAKKDNVECPLCMEAFDVDDINFFPCSCGYQVCRFCWHRLRTSSDSLCPACRQIYSENPANFQPVSSAGFRPVSRHQRRHRPRTSPALTGGLRDSTLATSPHGGAFSVAIASSCESRRHLVDVRVVQRNLVFVVGLPARLADPEVLKSTEYFGQFGKIRKVLVNNNSSSQNQLSSAHVTYYLEDDALQAICAVNNQCIGNNRMLRVSLGTTKYCSMYLRNVHCTKADCTFLHEQGDELGSFTKEEMQQGKHQEYEKQLLDIWKARKMSQNALSSSTTIANTSSSLQHSRYSSIPFTTTSSGGHTSNTTKSCHSHIYSTPHPSNTSAATAPHSSSKALSHRRTGALVSGAAATSTVTTAAKSFRTTSAAQHSQSRAHTGDEAATRRERICESTSTSSSQPKSKGGLRSRNHSVTLTDLCVYSAAGVRSVSDSQVGSSASAAMSAVTAASSSDALLVTVPVDSGCDIGPLTIYSATSRHYSTAGGAVTLSPLTAGGPQQSVCTVSSTDASIATTGARRSKAAAGRQTMFEAFSGLLTPPPDTPAHQSSTICVPEDSSAQSVSSVSASTDDLDFDPFEITRRELTSLVERERLLQQQQEPGLLGESGGSQYYARAKCGLAPTLATSCTTHSRAGLAATANSALTGASSQPSFAAVSAPVLLTTPPPGFSDYGSSSSSSSSGYGSSHLLSNTSLTSTAAMFAPSNYSYDTLAWSSASHLLTQPAPDTCAQQQHTVSAQPVVNGHLGQSLLSANGNLLNYFGHYGYTSGSLDWTNQNSASFGGSYGNGCLAGNYVNGSFSSGRSSNSSPVMSYHALTSQYCAPLSPARSDSPPHWLESVERLTETPPLSN